GFSGLMAHPTDCDKFLNCDNGRTFIQQCGPGTLFSPDLRVCDYPQNVDCPGEEDGEGDTDKKNGTNVTGGGNKKNSTNVTGG
ncbi:chitin binding domain-containing protein, partial [bacterium LRH843]|nr:chitin binding domain-containing protein [bacterium LRH843]